MGVGRFGHRWRKCSLVATEHGGIGRLLFQRATLALWAKMRLCDAPAQGIPFGQGSPLHPRRDSPSQVHIASVSSPLIASRFHRYQTVPTLTRSINHRPRSVATASPPASTDPKPFGATSPHWCSPQSSRSIVIISICGGDNAFLAIRCGSQPRCHPCT